MYKKIQQNLISIRLSCILIQNFISNTCASKFQGNNKGQVKKPIKMCILLA